MKWFALHVKPRHEKAVEQQLHTRLVEAYVPHYLARRRWSDRTKTVEFPLFPRYVFCRFTFEDRQKVLRIPSIVSLVGFGGTPCPISDNDIETIKSMIASGLPIMPWPYLSAGERVRICHGPLAHMEGILMREKAGCRVVVSIDLLQRGVAVEVERDAIEPVGGPKRPPVSTATANPYGSAVASVG